MLGKVTFPSRDWEAILRAVSASVVQHSPQSTVHPELIEKVSSGQKCAVWREN